MSQVYDDPIGFLHLPYDTSDQNKDWRQRRYMEDVRNDLVQRDALVNRNETSWIHPTVQRRMFYQKHIWPDTLTQSQGNMDWLTSVRKSINYTSRQEQQSHTRPDMVHSRGAPVGFNQIISKPIPKRDDLIGKMGNVKNRNYNWQENQFQATNYKYRDWEHQETLQSQINDVGSPFGSIQQDTSQRLSILSSRKSSVAASITELPQDNFQNTSEQNMIQLRQRGSSTIMQPVDTEILERLDYHADILDKLLDDETGPTFLKEVYARAQNFKKGKGPYWSNKKANMESSMNVLKNYIHLGEI